MLTAHLFGLPVAAAAAPAIPACAHNYGYIRATAGEPGRDPLLWCRSLQVLSYPRPQWIFLFFGNPQAVSGDQPESRRQARPGTQHGFRLAVIRAACRAVCQ